MRTALTFNLKVAAEYMLPYHIFIGNRIERIIDRKILHIFHAKSLEPANHRLFDEAPLFLGPDLSNHIKIRVKNIIKSIAMTGPALIKYAGFLQECFTVIGALRINPGKCFWRVNITRFLSHAHSGRLVKKATVSSLVLSERAMTVG